MNEPAQPSETGKIIAFHTAAFRLTMACLNFGHEVFTLLTTQSRLTSFAHIAGEKNDGVNTSHPVTG